MAKRETILDRWDITPEYFTRVIEENPSLRGINLGYIAERKLRDIFDADPRAAATRKDDDHDRKRKGDLVVTYKGFEFRFEVKSLQTNSVQIFDGDDPNPADNDERWVPRVVRRDKKFVENEIYRPVWNRRRLDGLYRGVCQCDASDRREVVLPNKTKIQTTNLRVGEFDVLAAGLFAFREKWDFTFALNRDLPRSVYEKYPPKVRKHLLATLIPVTWPFRPPFVSDPFILLDRLAAERQRTKP